MAYKRIPAVGDMHGMYDKLIAFMEKTRFKPKEDLLTFRPMYERMGKPHQYLVQKE